MRSSSGETAAHLAAQLAMVPALQGIATATRERLAEIAASRSFERGEEILGQGKETSSFLVLVSGRAKMSCHFESGRTVLLALFGPGDLFGVVAALGGETCSASVFALEPTVCLEVRRDNLYELFAEGPETISELLPVLTGQLAECNNCIVELTVHRIEYRFAQVFLKLAKSLGQTEPTGIFIPIRLSRQELADLVGTTIETCIRTMSRWGKEGLLETSERGFLLRDVAALEQILETRGPGNITG